VDASGSIGPDVPFVHEGWVDQPPAGELSADWTLKNCTASSVMISFNSKTSGLPVESSVAVSLGSCTKSCGGGGANPGLCARGSGTVPGGYCASMNTANGGCSCSTTGTPGLARAQFYCQPTDMICWASSDGESGCLPCQTEATINLQCP
jgi:hypothetical protein